MVEDFGCLPVPGDAVITAGQLKIAKAREFARALRRLPFVRLTECRRSESPAFEAVAFDSFDHRRDQTAEFPGEFLELFVIRVLQERVVQVADKMDQAFLLRTVYGFVCGVEIRY